MNKSVLFLPVLVILFSCLSFQNLQSMREAPKNPGSFPKLSERNRLLGALLPERTCYDVQHYDINIDIDVDNKYLKGYVDITAVALNDFSLLQVDLAKNMKLNGIYYLGTQLPATRKEDAVIIQFPQIEYGSEFKFRVAYEGTPRAAKIPPWDGGFVWQKDKKGRHFISVACEGDGAGLWWPLKDHIADEPDNGARMRFTVPADLFCVSNGRLTDISEDNKLGKKIYTWEVNNPINNYNISVQLGHYVLVQDTLYRKGEIEMLNHYVLDYHEEVAKNHFSQAREVIHFFEKYFGDYQWWDDGFKLVEVSYLGMEHQSAVTYGNTWNNWSGAYSWLNQYYGIVDGLLFHETAHEWWGNSITAADPSHMWIHEGMAVYSEAVFIEDKLGYNVMVDFLLEKRKGITNKLPVVGPENENYWAFGDSYPKGAWIMHTLRHVINNDDLWWKILKSFAVDNARSHVRTSDFQRHVETWTDKDFTYFFNQYFFYHKPPKLEYTHAGNKLFYRWSNVIGDFQMPIDIDINGIENRIFPTTEIQTIETTEFPVIIFRDWEFLVTIEENPELIR